MDNSSQKDVWMDVLQLVAADFQMSNTESIRSADCSHSQRIRIQLHGIDVQIRPNSGRMAQCTKVEFPFAEKFVPRFLTNEKVRWGRRSGVEFAYAHVVMDFDGSWAGLIEVPNLQTNWLKGVSINSIHSISR